MPNPLLWGELAAVSEFISSGDVPVDKEDRVKIEEPVAVEAQAK